MNGERVGTWQVRAGRGHELAYSPSWLDSPNARPLSLSLPLRPFNQEIDQSAPVGRDFLKRRFFHRICSTFSLIDFFNQQEVMPVIHFFLRENLLAVAFQAFGDIANRFAFVQNDLQRLADLQLLKL